jgi:hypothetical protein
MQKKWEKGKKGKKAPVGLVRSEQGCCMKYCDIDAGMGCDGLKSRAWRKRVAVWSQWLTKSRNFDLSLSRKSYKPNGIHAYPPTM